MMMASLSRPRSARGVAHAQGQAHRAKTKSSPANAGANSMGAFQQGQRPKLAGRRLQPHNGCAGKGGEKKARLCGYAEATESAA